MRLKVRRSGDWEFSEGHVFEAEICQLGANISCLTCVTYWAFGAFWPFRPCSNFDISGLLSCLSIYIFRSKNNADTGVDIGPRAV